MLIQAIIINLLFIITTARKRYRATGRGAGVGKVTQTFGNGVASLIKDIKQGNWGGQQTMQQYDERSRSRPTAGDDSKYYQSIGNDMQFYVTVIVVSLVIVIGILYFIIKVLPQMSKRDTVEQMRKRNAERFKHYEAIKCIAQNGVHPDKAFGRLQKIKYR